MSLHLYIHYIFSKNRRSINAMICTCVFLQLFAFGLDYAAIWVVGQSVDRLSAEYRSGIPLIGLFLLLGALAAVFSVIVARFRPHIQNNIASKLRKNMLHGLNSKPYMFFKMKHGQWYELLVAQTCEFSYDAWQILLKVLEITASITVAVFLLSMVSIEATAALSLLAPIAVIFVIRIMKVALKTHEVRLEANREYTAVISENIGLMKMIKAYSYVAARLRRDEQAAKQKLAADIGHLRSVLKCMSSEKIAELSCYILLLAIAIFQLSAGKITTGAIIVILGYSTRVLQQLSQINYVYDMWKNNQYIYATLLENGLETPTQGGCEETQAARDRVVNLHIAPFDVSYGARSVLVGLQLSVMSGEAILIRGASGCGKTTFLMSLLGMLSETPPLEINGMPTQIDDSQLRRRMGYLAQDPFLFGGTVAENIRMGDEAASDAEIECVLQRVGLQDLALDRPIGENGKHLSGGEKQRLAFARVLLQEKDIYLLDEPLAHIDAVNKEKVLGCIRDLKKSSIVIVVSHQEIPKGVLERQYVLEGGKLLETTA